MLFKSTEIVNSVFEWIVFSFFFLSELIVNRILIVFLIKLSINSYKQRYSIDITNDVSKDSPIACPWILKSVKSLQATYLKIGRQSPLIAPRREVVVFKANWKVKLYYYYYYYYYYY